MKSFPIKWVILIVSLSLTIASAWLTMKNPKPAWSDLALGASIGLLANVVVAVWQSHESGKELKAEVGIVTSTLHDATKDLLQKTGQSITSLGAATNDLIAKVTEKISELGNDVQARHQRLETTSFEIAKQVSIMVDASRKPLEDFPAIFAQAEKMIVEKEPSLLRILTFTPCFGLIHSYNKCLYSRFFELMYPGEKWKENNVASFKGDLLHHIERIKTQIEGAATNYNAVFQLATFDHVEVKTKFLKPLADKTPDICQLIETDGKLVDRVANDHNAFLDGIEKKILAHKNFHGEESARCKKLNYLSDFPLQMIITHHGNKRACLVFFIGTLTLEQEQPPGGFYTENEPLVSLFESVFDSIVQTNKKTEQTSSDT